MKEPSTGHGPQQVWQRDSPQYFPASLPRWSHSVTSGAPQCIPWQPQESYVWRYLIALQGPQGCRTLQTDWRLSLYTLVHMSSPSASQDETQCGCVLEAFWTYMQLEWSNIKPVISRKELGNSGCKWGKCSLNEEHSLREETELMQIKKRLHYDSINGYSTASIKDPNKLPNNVFLAYGRLNLN